MCACVCVCVFNDGSVYVCAVHFSLCVCAHPEWGRGTRKVGREGHWGLVYMCVYVSLLCEIKHANGGLF